MTQVTYRVVEHDGGWAYKSGDVFSETFATHDKALAAARHAARLQRTPGRAEIIQYENSKGEWISETVSGSDRPDTAIEDDRSAS